MCNLIPSSSVALILSCGVNFGEHWKSAETRRTEHEKGQVRFWSICSMYNVLHGFYQKQALSSTMMLAIHVFRFT